MAVKTTVEQLAKLVGMSATRLLKQMQEAGIDLNKADQEVSSAQKAQLLKYLQSGKKPTKTAAASAEDQAEKKPVVKKPVLRRREEVSQMKTGDSGRKTVTVKVRKRTIIKPVEEEVPVEEPAPVQEAPETPVEAEATTTVKTDKPADKPAGNKPSAEPKKTKPKAATPASKPKIEEAQRKKPKSRLAGTSSKEKYRLTTAAAMSNAEREASVAVAETPASRRRKRGKVDLGSTVLTEHAFERPTAPVTHEVVVPESITVAELAVKMSVKAAAVIKVMMGMGSMATINQVIDQDTATLIVEEMGHKARRVSDNAVEESLDDHLDNAAEKISRPPVVTIMGHVDHGKTSLLDYIRRTKVASGEAGGITQHIGAYHVETERGTITFLDTPGHEAFTAMRARGAQCTDIVILIVAADDGVMPQTVEAVQHAKAAGVPMIVAVNKIDKPDADPDRVKTELSQHDVLPEDWGGDVMFQHVSAKTGDGVDDLLEAILVLSEMQEFTAVASGSAKGIIIESRLDKGRGSVATMLVQQGTLRKGDIVLAGRYYGRVRALVGEAGKEISSAGPSIPAEILGLNGTPNAGDDVFVVPTERRAREVAMFREGKYRDVKLARQGPTTLEDIFSVGKEDVKTLNLVLKADVQGSAEAITESLAKLNNDEVAVNIVSVGVGGINASDVHLAIASHAIMIGFNVRADNSARKLVEDNAVMLHYHSIIYDVIDEVKQVLSGMLSPALHEKIIGLAEVRDVFRSPKLGAIAGCMVLEGAVKRNKPIRVLRDNVVIYEGELESLRRFKEDVGDVTHGKECGIGVKNYNDVKVGDQIEVFETIEVARTIDDKKE
ncbi:MAG: hypothetical protein DHS20C10_03460 [marine bacterium B5-7]|nr:MAG: hypothetical protein DHS20C10_03460 [marine bacterium B5-7]